MNGSQAVRIARSSISVTGIKGPASGTNIRCPCPRNHRSTVFFAVQAASFFAMPRLSAGMLNKWLRAEWLSGGAPALRGLRHVRAQDPGPDPVAGTGHVQRIL